MGMEIKRNSWVQFCKKFNASNQLRPATVSIAHKGEDAVGTHENTPFMGLTLTKKGRLIDGIELFAGSFDPDHLVKPIATVKEPSRIVLEKRTDGTDDRLVIEGKDGTVASVALTDTNVPDQRQAFVEKVAYSMYERRGHTHGNDVNDWLEAERRVTETELQFVK
ncbi:MAG: DUF2934 domain-containing protein [Candidatus Zixiibacteriota bacterium]